MDPRKIGSSIVKKFKRVSRKTQDVTPKPFTTADTWLWPSFLAKGKLVAPETTGLPHKASPEHQPSLWGPPSKGLCMFCKVLPVDILPPGSEIPVVEYHFNQLEERLKEEDGPYWCGIYFAVQDLYRFWLDNRYITWSRPFRSVTCHWPELGWYRKVLIDSDDGDIFWDTRQSRYSAIVHSDPLSVPTLARVRKWIETCNKEHESCRVTEVPKMPTRVLDVGDSEDSRVFLVETQGQCGQYTALSHCWGESNSFLTTRDTLEEMKGGFMLEQTPATFRDAIIITRKLGIRYLWIDSLCIIHGDTKDWETESSKMGEVYRDAYLTIGASNASSDVEGFLKPRLLACSSLKVVFPGGMTHQIYLLDTTDQRYSNDDRERFLDEPLITRGWTLQEAYLSRRQLKFMKHQIVLDCQEHLKEESACPDGPDFDKINGGAESLGKLYPSRENDFLPIYGGWYEMIQKYSQRKVTFHSDRLPALSGLAKLTATHQNGNYLAGLWWEDIALGLCWRGEYRERFIKPDCYVAPSWSWASVVGSVRFSGPSHSSLDISPLRQVTFKNYGLHYRGDSHFGQVEGGWIRVSAPLALFTYMALGEDAKAWNILTIGVHPTTVNAGACLDFDQQETEDLRLLFLLREEHDSEGRSSYRDEAEFGGIVIKMERELSKETYKDLPLHAGKRQVYKRVGYFYMGDAFDIELDELVSEIFLI